MSGPRQNRFVILCLGRSGSTHLQSLLDSHPQVRCYGELFNPREGSAQISFVHAPEDDPGPYLERVMGETSEPVAGFKLPMGSIRANPGVVGVLESQPEMKAIRLDRENKLAQFVSRRMLAETLVPQSIHGDYGETTIRIDPDHCIKALQKMHDNEAELDRMAEGHPTFRTTYEQLVAGSGIAEIQEFLEVEPVELSSWFEKLRKRPLSQTVENWDELVEALRATRFAELADDRAV